MKKKISKIESLNDNMQNFKLPKTYFVKPDEITGKRYAVASNGDNGSVNIHSNFMSYEEFNAYLFGWNHATINASK